MKRNKTPVFLALLSFCGLFLAVDLTVRAQSGPPELPPTPLAIWTLDNGNWENLWHDPPLGFTNLNLAPSWYGSAVSVDTNVPTFLNVPGYGTDHTNITFDNGAIALWCQPNWTSATDGGTGPQGWAILFQAGRFSTNFLYGCWSLAVSPDGNTLSFITQTNGAGAVQFQTSIDWDAGDWHYVVLDYTPTNCSLFLEGNLVTNMPPIAYWPSYAECSNNGLWIGSDPSGTLQAHAQFQDLETYDVALSTNLIQWNYTLTSGDIVAWGGSVPILGGLGGHFGDSVPSPPGGFGGGGSGGTGGPVIANFTYTTNSDTAYADYTNFWLTIALTNSNTNVVVMVQNTLSNLTYNVLTNSVLDPNLADWGIWKTNLATNSTIVEPPYNIGTNALFFAGRLVLITGTNNLPDWWQMLYFDQLGVSPTGNPAGDGIDNLQKYLLGLNPNIAYVNPLIVTPPAGNYTASPSIAIYSLAGATIKYTTNGTAPSSTNGFSTTSGLVLTNIPTGSFTLQAWESGLTPNVPLTNIYTIVPAIPTFTVPGGFYGSATNLQISCATPNAVVRYTTNGTAPTTNSAQIQATNIITIATNEIIEATAWLGTTSNGPASATYVITGPPANDNYSNAVTLSGASGAFSGTTLGSTIEGFESANPSNYFSTQAYYGDSVWYKWTAPSNGTVFLDISKTERLLYGVSVYYYPTNVTANPTNLVPATLTATADNTSFTFAATNTVAYYISVSDFPSLEGAFNLAWGYTSQTATPIFMPDAGTYTNAQGVFILYNDTNATIRYTTNGVDPTTNSAIVAAGTPIFIWTNATLKAAAWRAGLTESAVKSAAYVINASSTNPTIMVSAPTLSPTNSAFTNSLTVTLTCTNAGAVIHYTTNGNIPTSSDPSVTSGGTITLSNSAMVNASGWVTNMNPSVVITGLFAKAGVDTDQDGIPDTAELVIGSNPFASDANNVNPNSLAGGLDNFQVYKNPSVLLGVNYSSLNDGVPDWWKVKYGYSTNTAASTIADNGQTLSSDFAGDDNPDDPNARSGTLGPIDFHIVHGPTNSMVLVLDNVNPNIVDYLLYCAPAAGATVLKEIPLTQALSMTNGGVGRYFPLPNPQLAPGQWVFTLQGVDGQGHVSKPSASLFSRLAEDQEIYGLALYNQFGVFTPYSNAPVEAAGYTNDSALRAQTMTQILRAQSDAWVFPADGHWNLYGSDLHPFTTPTWWGTPVQFEYYGPGTGYYGAYGGSSYFPTLCEIGNTTDCADYLAHDDYWFLLFNSELLPLQILTDGSGQDYFYMPDDSWGAAYRYNPAGLKYLSVQISYSNQPPLTLTPGESNAIPANADLFEAALQTETPALQPVSYVFDGRQYPLYVDSAPSFASTFPPNFVPLTNTADWYSGPDNPSGAWVVAPLATEHPIIVGMVGRPVNLQSWCGVLPVHTNNGSLITNTTYWISQDFDQAYLCSPATGDVPRTSQTNWDGRFKIDTNNAVKTGILSPNLIFAEAGSYYYGIQTMAPFPQQQSAEFTPTQPGKVILTTQPDANGNYGEVVVYVIDMQVDANHDGLMDNRDLTSLNNPDTLWVNNNYDRTPYDADDSAFYDDDVATNDPIYSPSPGTPGVSTPDYNYQAADGTQVISTLRDLQDYFRLWIPGLSNMVANLPTNYTVTLQWRNNTGAAIRLFKAAETNGGTNYLFNQSEGNVQLIWDSYPCYGFVSSSRTISLNQAFASTTIPKPSDYFIFCGAAAGNDELVCQVKNPLGGVVGEASVFLNLKDIKQMYERWSVGEYPNPPSNIATNCGDDGSPFFQYPYDPSVDSSIPYILFVHGWNMETWEKDRFAESAFKRLYWQGYQGRFGVFRWPTDYDFNGTLIDAILQPHNYDGSEYTAWQSANGLMNKLVALNIQYPTQVYMLAHSMGNVVAGEALRLAAQQGSGQIVNTYVASQAAIPAHVYDATVTSPYLINYAYAAYGDPAPGHPNTPNIYGNRLTNNAAAVAQRINFYNANDYALAPGAWCFDQEHKPDAFIGSGYYYYNGSTNDPAPWNNFEYAYYAGGFSSIDIVTNLDGRYQVLGYAANPYSTALGATPIASFGSVSLTRTINPIWPTPDPLGNNFTEHFWHSAQFRGDNWMLQGYWNELLGVEAFGLKQ